MKRILLLFIISFLLPAAGTNAQVTTYYFDQFVCGNTYTPITGGITYLTNGNDNFVHSANIGFNFTFNGISYSTCNISTNGFITFGATAPSWTNYVPLSASEGYAGCISALGMDIRQLGTGELRSLTEGTAPNRVFTVQFKDYGTFTSSCIYNFQIKLFETSNKIEVHYGSFTVTTTKSPQVGLRGAVNTEYAARWQLTGQTWLTSSAATCNCQTAVSTTNFPMNSLRYRWTVPSAMTYVSSTTTQTNTADVLRGTANTQLIGIEIVMTGNQSPQTLESVSFNTTGTTNPAGDITNAKLWTTSGSCAYATSVQLGSTVAAPNGSFTVSGLSTALTPGPNYLWLSYDVNSEATPGNFVDAECTSITINGSSYTPGVTAPSGSREIVGPMSGTLHIGAGKDYTTISSAFSDLNIRGISSPVTLVLDDAVYSSETFPITINSIPGASSTNTVKITLNASFANSPVAPVISGSSSTMIFDFNGADYVTFDGRPGGTGTTKGLTIRNTSTATTASTIRLINDAQNNVITYCIIEGSSTNSAGTGGNIYFATPVSSGNDNNTISFCDIRDRTDASATPYYCIAATGSGSFGPDNSGNVITNNNIYNYFFNGGFSAGIFLAAGCTQWTITNNHIYQTSTRTSTISTNTYGINITTGGGSFGYTITGNYIGGSAPNADGSPWTFTTTGASAGNMFFGIRLNQTAGALPSSIQGNTIKNLSLTTNPPTTGIVWFTGIQINGGANIGNVTPNIIGASTGNGSINITFGNTTSITTHVRGIDMVSSSSFSGSIANNIIGSFTISGTSTGLVTFNGINTGGIPSSAFSISGNTIGSTSTAGSIQATSAAMPVYLNGITCAFTSNTNSITNNTIANFTNSSTAANGQVTGIVYSGTVNTSITGNTIRDLSSATTNTGTAANANNIVGILSTSGASIQAISTNQIYSLRHTNTGIFNTIVTGIGMTHTASTGGTLSRNRIYDLTNVSTGTGPSIYGIFTNSPGWTVTNNQVTITNGEAADNNEKSPEEGDASTNNVIIRGIYDNSTNGTSNIYYNSVYVGGNTSSGSNNSYAYYRDGSVTLNLKNNLFYNARTGGTGFHYAIGNTNATGFSSSSSNYNVFVAPNASRVGEWTGSLGRSIDEWRTSSSGDAQSWSTISSVVTAANLFTSISGGNLLIQSGNAAAWLVSGKGTFITGQSVDYEGNTRQVLVTGGVTDIGSDEFTAAPPSSPSATESAPPAANTTTTYTLYGRVICTINWGATGSFPAGMTVRYNSGVLPGNIVGSGRSSYSYWTVTPTSGSLTGKYCITFNFGDNETYNINTPSSNTILAKKDGTVWEVYSAYSSGATNWKSQLNWAAKTIRVDSLHSFSDFALTDGTLPLPVTISSFESSLSSRNVTLRWITEAELNNRGFDIERKLIMDNNEPSEWKKVSFIEGHGTTNSQHTYNFTDKKLSSGKYRYRLKQVDFNGSFEYYELAEDVVIGTPKAFNMSQNYPNPSNPVSKIDYELPADMKVTIKVYDITGREVSQLADEFKTAGYYTADFNGSALASGVYFYRIIAEGSSQKFSKTMKMILVK